ncbi:hypothetical protein GCM10022222_30500 [Amycolatopsis ultiminotia]|uniref:Transposase n=1 Tax=Amycolatopsis ultiminotia TaxID=543629 RepID=A0ABP6W4G7_9PSEU
MEVCLSLGACLASAEEKRACRPERVSQVPKKGATVGRTRKSRQDWPAGSSVPRVRYAPEV